MTATRRMSDEPRTYRTETGRVLTDADFDALADEAERGYDVKQLIESQRQAATAEELRAERDHWRREAREWHQRFLMLADAMRRLAS